jgi:hypothetical protein
MVLRERAMDDQDIIEFIRSLEKMVAKENAEAQFVGFGEVALYANKSGYLRLSLELMKCAFEETYPEADLNYLFNEDSDFSIDHLTTNKEQLKFLST